MTRTAFFGSSGFVTAAAAKGKAVTQPKGAQARQQAAKAAVSGKIARDSKASGSGASQAA